MVRYFVVVAEELHFGRAAARLFIAQPSLSAQIRRLEVQLGAPLLVRTSRRVELTAAGARFLEVAYRLLAVAAEARESVWERRPVRVATIVDGLDTLPLVLRELRRVSPGVGVRQGLAGMPAQVAGVRAGSLDVALGRRSVLAPELAGEVVRADPVRVVLRADSPLAVRDPIPLVELAGAHWVFGNAEHTPDWVDFVVGFLRRAGIDPGPVSSGQVPLSAMLEQVVEEAGVAAWPDSCPRPGAGLVVRSIVPEPVFVWELVWLRESAGEPVVVALREAARAAAERHGWLTREVGPVAEG
ncbi:LysR family transcriptional regulator StgR [Herbidospora sp. RD11066]